MGTVCIKSTTPCPTLKGCKWGFLVFHRKRLEPNVLPWQHHGRWHSVDFAMNISRAKFEEHCSNISGDILDTVFCCLWRHHLLHNTKTWISLKRKKIFQKGKRHSSLPWKSFQISSIFFLLHRHFNTCEQLGMHPVAEQLVSPTTNER